MLAKTATLKASPASFCSNRAALRTAVCGGFLAAVFTLGAPGVAQADPGASQAAPAAQADLPQLPAAEAPAQAPPGNSAAEPAQAAPQLPPAEYAAPFPVPSAAQPAPGAGQYTFYVDPATVDPPQDSRTPTRSSAQAKKIAGLVMTSVGGVAFVGGLAWLIGSTFKGTLLSPSSDTGGQIGGIMTTLLGAGTLAPGLVLFFKGRKQLNQLGPEAPKTSLSITPGAGSLSVSGTF